MTAIAIRFPDESVELDNVEEHRALKTLEVIYEGGSLHGKTSDFPTRDVERVVDASYQWELSGPNGGDWWLIVNDGTYTIGRETFTTQVSRL